MQCDAAAPASINRPRRLAPTPIILLTGVTEIPPGVMRPLIGRTIAMSKNLVQDQNPPSLLVTRRQFLPLLGATTALVSTARGVLAAAPSDASGKPSGAKSRFVYVGTYTAPGIPPGGTHPSTAVGIYVFTMSPRDGNLTLVQVVPADNPSFLALDPTLAHLYSANEMTSGRVSAYSIEPPNGKRIC